LSPVEDGGDRWNWPLAFSAAAVARNAADRADLGRRPWDASSYRSHGDLAEEAPMAVADTRFSASWRILQFCLWGLVVAAIIAVAGLAGYGLGRQERAGARPLPVLGTAPAYSLTNQLGQTVASSQFRGKVQIVSFLDPYCTQLCPLVAAHLVNLENFGLRPAHIENKVALVSFNLRPESTGPRQMRAFLSQYGWNPTDLHWQFLTGPAGAIRPVVRQGFHVWYQRVNTADESKPGDVPQMVQPEIVNKLADSAHPQFDILHNDIIEIVDQQGRIRKLYDNANVVGWQNLLPVVQSLVVK
jgi:protein SCO1